MLKDSGKRLEGSNNMKLSTVVIGEKSINPGGKPRFSRTREVDTGTIDESELKSSNEPTTDAKFCEKLLQDGFVQSLDFYHLTHRLDPNPSDNRGIERIQIPAADNRIAKENNVNHLVDIVNGDALYADLSLYSAISVFLVPSCLEVLRPSFADHCVTGTRIVSYKFPFPEPWEVVKTIECDDIIKKGAKTQAYLYLVP